MTVPSRWFVETVPNRPLSRRRHEGSAILILLTLLALLSAGLLYLLTQSKSLALLVLCLAVLVAASQVSARTVTGILLLLIPLQWLTIALLQFNHVSQYQAISAIKELILVSSAIWFFTHSKSLRLTIPDAILGCAIVCAFFEQIFHPDIKGLRDDWEWALVYILGRVLVLNPALQAIWARCAVWMCAMLAILGIWEVEFLGPTPRLLLARATTGATRLPPAFTATGYAGLRAASTMVSPLSFSGLCLIGLVLWWTYMKNPLPGILISAGLIFTLTRSAIAAAAVCVLIVALRRHEYRRIALYGILAVVSIAIAIPTLQLGRFLQSSVVTGADTSTIGHENSVAAGVQTIFNHPLGIGAGTIGPRALVDNPDAQNIESSYLTIAAEYGVLVGVLFLTFCLTSLWSVYRLRDSMGYAAFSVLLGYMLLLAFGPIHLDIPLACWVWIPTGMAVTQAASSSKIPSMPMSA